MDGLTTVFRSDIQFGFDLFYKSFTNELPQPPAGSKYRITENNIQRADQYDSDRVTEGGS